MGTLPSPSFAGSVSKCQDRGTFPDWKPQYTQRLADDLRSINQLNKHVVELLSAKGPAGAPVRDLDLSSSLTRCAYCFFSYVAKLPLFGMISNQDSLCRKCMLFGFPNRFCCSRDSTSCEAQTSTLTSILRDAVSWNRPLVHSRIFHLGICPKQSETSFGYRSPYRV